MEIRRATPADAPAMARVQVAGWRAAYREIAPAEVLADLTVERATPRWERALAEAEWSVLVACASDGTVIGFAAAGPSGDADATPETGELRTLYVGPEHWGEGIGTRLWEASRATLVERGFREATLWTLRGNRIGRAFYERRGFAPDPHEGPGYEVGGVVLSTVRYRIRLD